MKASPVISNQFSIFVLKCQEMINAHYAQNFPILTPSKLTVNEGRKYWKVVSTSDGGSGQTVVYAFVDKNNGEVYKPATWRAPAKHSRGNVSDEDISKFMTPHGPVYLS
jgi:hypothetical protein